MKLKNFGKNAFLFGVLLSFFLSSSFCYSQSQYSITENQLQTLEMIQQNQKQLIESIEESERTTGELSSTNSDFERILEEIR